MWLNTCVGKQNYSYFFRTMLSITAMLVVHCTIHLALVLDIYLGSGSSKSRAEDWFSVGSELPVVIVMCIFLLFDLVALSLIGQLLLFHTRLQREGLTTYQFIVRDNQRKREQATKDRELEQRRLMAVAKAREEGRNLAALRMQAGGFFRKCGLVFCDPLDQHSSEGVASENSGSQDSLNDGSEKPETSNQEESKEPEDV